MNLPTAKFPGSNETTVTTGAMIGAAVTVALFIVNNYALPPEAIKIPAEIGAAITVFCTGIGQRFIKG